MFKQNLSPACCLSALLVFCAAGTLWGVEYDFTTGSNQAPSSAPANITASNFTAGPGLTGPMGAGEFEHYFTTSDIPGTFNTAGNPADGALVRSTGTTNSEAGAIAADDYVSFTITPDTGYLLNFQDLTFDLTSSDNIGADTDFAANVAIRSSLDNFATTLDTFIPFNAGPGAVVSGDWVHETLDLSAVEFQNVSSAVEFRLYFFDNFNNNSDAVRFDSFDVAVAAQAAAVPEPSALIAFLVAAAVALPIGWRTTRARRVPK